MTRCAALVSPTANVPEWLHGTTCMLDDYDHEVEPSSGRQIHKVIWAQLGARVASGPWLEHAWVDLAADRYPESNSGIIRSRAAASVPDPRDPWRGEALPDPANPYGAKFHDEQMSPSASSVPSPARPSGETE